MSRPIHLLLAATGSVATIKLPSIVTALGRHPNILIRIILSDSAKRFLAGQSAEQPHYTTLASLPNVDALYDDASEWDPAWTRGGDVLHISLRRWADLLVVAPLSANALARLSNGMSDDLLMSVCRAWDTDGQVDGAKKGIVLAPAMNTAMWRHPVTERHLEVLRGWDWIEVLQPQGSKVLACGDVGVGAMTEWTEVVKETEKRLGLT